MHGIAHYKSENGDSYVGEFKFDKFDGEGQLNYSNSDMYSGMFVNGQRSGYGQLMQFSN